MGKEGGGTDRERERDGEKERKKQRHRERESHRQGGAKTEAQRQMQGERQRERQKDRERNNHRETTRCFSGQEIARMVPRDRGLSSSGRQTHNDVCPSGSPELVRET